MKLINHKLQLPIWQVCDAGVGFQVEGVLRAQISVAMAVRVPFVIRQAIKTYMKLIKAIIRTDNTLLSMDPIHRQVRRDVIHYVWEKHFVDIPPKGIRATDFQ